jgi:hypothetical protein
MALFYKSISATPGTLPKSVKGDFLWGRLIACIVFLIVILIAAIYTGQIDKLEQLYGILINTFEVFTGALAGLIIGESQKP